MSKGCKATMQYTLSHGSRVDPARGTDVDNAREDDSNKRLVEGIFRTLRCSRCQRIPRHARWPTAKRALGDAHADGVELDVVLR